MSERSGARRLLRRIATASAIAASAFAISAGPASAHPGRQSEFWGMDMGGLPAAASPATMQQLRDARVGTLRTNLTWGVVEPVLGAPYDWTAYDRMFQLAARRGIRISLDIYGSPAYAAADAHNMPPLTGTVSHRFRAFIRAAVERYGEGGDFWSSAGMRGVKALPVKTWEVWNEPNLGVNDWGQADPRAYGRLLVEVSRAIRSVDRNATVVAAGLFSLAHDNATDMEANRFLNRMYQVRGVRHAFDALSVHPYGHTPHDVMTALWGQRRVLDEHNDATKPLSITEMGWATASGNSNSLVVSRSRQARDLTRTYNNIRHERSRLDVSLVSWYYFQDGLPRSAAGTWDQYAGLFDVHGNAKPAWKALLRQTARGLG